MTTFRRYTLTAAAIFLAMLCSGEACAGTRIGVFLFSSENRYQEAYRGFREAMKQEGYSEPGTTYVVENANGNKASAAELVKKLADSKFDLYFTTGTSATTALSRVVKDRPIVFSVVYDPVKSGIAESWRSSGNNTTGSSTLLPMSAVFDMLKLLKDVKKLAVLYNPGESNSEYTLRDLMALQQSRGIRVIPVPMTKNEDFTSKLPEVMRTSDAVYVTGSNFVDSHISDVVASATRYHTATVTHLEDLVEKGVLLGVTSDSFQIGRLAGEKAAKILKGAKPSAIPIETSRKHVVVLNRKSARAAQIRIPDGLAAIVGRNIK